MNKSTIITKEAKHANLREVTLMALDLWKDHTYNELFQDFERILESENDTVFICESKEETIGFMHISIRHDYVEGSNSSPVGFVEGVYVKPDFRKNGVARKLIEAGENWTKDKNCTQMGSDVEFDNNVSYAFHLKAGFEEVNRIICFIKDL